MARKKARVLISFVIVYMVFLLVSSATTTVAAENWGNLKVRDEMKWKLVPDPVDNPDSVVYLELRIMGFSGDEMAYKYTMTAVYDSSTEILDEESPGSSDEDAWYVFSQGYLQKMKTYAEEDPNMTWTETEFNWKGTNYKAYYMKQIDDLGIFEGWIDQGTGISFEIWRTISGTTYTYLELERTTATLTRTGLCLGTIFIAFISVATFISFSVVRYKKKKRV